MHKITPSLMASAAAGLFIAAITFCTGMSEAQQYIIDEFRNETSTRKSEWLWTVQQKLVMPSAIAAGVGSSGIVLLVLVARPSDTFLIKRKIAQLNADEKLSNLDTLPLLVALDEDQ